MDAAAQREGRVFVSSTCLDLIDLRADLSAALQECGLTPVLSDIPESDFRNDGKSGAMAVCLQNLEQSECVVCILSQRYGTPFPYNGSEPISATHHEIRNALKLKKPVLFYIRDRLLAEMKELQSNSRYKPKWTEKHDLKSLLDIKCELDKHPDFSGQTWFWTFRDSTSLCGRVIADLRAVSQTAKLRQLHANREIPVVSLKVSTTGPKSGDGTCTLQFVIENHGPGAISEVLLHGPDGNCKAHHCGVGVGGVAGEYLQSAIPAGQLWNGGHALANDRLFVFAIDYTISTGYRLREFFAFVPDEHYAARMVSIGKEVLKDKPRTHLSMLHRDENGHIVATLQEFKKKLDMSPFANVR